MSMYAMPVAKLIDAFEKLPGIGHKTAQRLAFHILGMPTEKAMDFAKASVEAKRTIQSCSVCGDLTDTDPCRVCGNEKETVPSSALLKAPGCCCDGEGSGIQRLYHVLHGVISPMEESAPTTSI